MQLRCRRVDFEFRSPFRIAYRTRSHAQTVLLELDDGHVVGRAEGLGVSYKGETADSVLEQLAAVAIDLRNDLSRTELPKLLGPGGARNALDCALWDLESKRRGRRAWELAGLDSTKPLLTAYTLGADAPESMGRAAAAAREYSLLKLKLTGEGDLERVSTVRCVRPDARLVVDANQAWDERQLQCFAPRLADLNVEMIEQPLPVGKDKLLQDFQSPVPLCADESCQTTECLSGIKDKYQFVNVKLDKAGGLTEALRLADMARRHGFRTIAGCMGGSSLSMAPAFVLGQLCDMVDLDGPLLLKSDVSHAIRYEGPRMFAPDSAVWG